MLSFALLVMLNFDRSTVKHALKNMQNDATSGFLTALECTKFVFGRGSARTRLGELTALSRPPGWFKGAYF